MAKPGWVVRQDDRSRHRVTGEPIDIVFYWYGPDHGYGRSWGTQAKDGHTFKTKTEAESAFRKEFGRLRSGISVQHLTEASEAEPDGESTTEDHDLMIYGEAFTDKDGKRIDPRSVRRTREP